MPEESSQPKRAARRNTLTPEAMKQAAARKSYWPFLLAAAISIALLGIVLFSNFILIIGIVLVIVAVIGWGLERH